MFPASAVSYTQGERLSIPQNYSNFTIIWKDIGVTVATKI